MWTKKKTPYFYILPTLLLLLTITIYPFVMGMILGVQNYNLARPDRRGFVGIDNFVEMVSDSRVSDALVNTLLFTGITVPIQLALGFGLALLLNRPFVGKAIVRTLLLIPMMLAPAIVGLVWRLLYTENIGILANLTTAAGFEAGWLTDPSRALYAIMVTDIWQWVPFMFLFLLAGLESLPKEPFEAAVVDGASYLQQLRFITLPLLAPHIATVLFLRIITSLKVFELIFIMTGGGPGVATETLNLYIYNVGLRFFRMGYATSMALVFTLVVLVISLIVIRYTLLSEES